MLDFKLNSLSYQVKEQGWRTQSTQLLSETGMKILHVILKLKLSIQQIGFLNFE